MMTYSKNITLGKVSADIKNEFDSKSVFNKKLLKTKIKSYNDEATDFHAEEVPDAGSDYTCLAVITVGSALKKDEIYYPQMSLKECKYT